MVKTYFVLLCYVLPGFEPILHFRMCKLLGQQFVQYLPVVMGPLMKAAAIRPEVTMVDSLDVDTLEDDTGWEFIKLGDQVSCIHFFLMLVRVINKLVF